MAASNKVDEVAVTGGGGDSSMSDVTMSTVGGGGLNVLGALSSLPQAIGSALGLVSRASAESKIDDAASTSSEMSVVSSSGGVNPLNAAIMGTATVGTVLWSMYIVSQGKKGSKIRRNGLYPHKRSADDVIRRQTRGREMSNQVANER